MTNKNPSKEAMALALEIAESRNYPGFPRRAAFRIDAIIAQTMAEERERIAVRLIGTKDNITGRDVVEMIRNMGDGR